MGKEYSLLQKAMKELKAQLLKQVPAPTHFEEDYGTKAASLEATIPGITTNILYQLIINHEGIVEITNDLHLKI